MAFAVAFQSGIAFTPTCATIIDMRKMPITGDGATLDPGLARFHFANSMLRQSSAYLIEARATRTSAPLALITPWSLGRPRTTAICCIEPFGSPDFRGRNGVHDLCASRDLRFSR